jgi:serine protease Do
MSNGTIPGPKLSKPDQPIYRLPRTFLAALLASTMIGAGAGAWIADASAVANAAPITVSNPSPQPGFAPLVSKVKPAVVQISTVSTLEENDADTEDGANDGHIQPQQDEEQAAPGLPPGFQQFFRNFGMGGGMRTMPSQPQEKRALGSGFVVDPTGYIVTNNHVVDGAREVSVTLTDGNKYKAKVIGRDIKTDLALLKIDAGHVLPYVAFGDSDGEHEGDWVIAVGNPYGLGGTVTAGIVSAHGRDIHSGPYDDFLQIDAPINPGNSGGPLFNQNGQVVGIDTAIYSPTGGSVGIGFAIPSNVAKQVVAQLREHGSVARGWIGVSMQPLTPALARAVGLKDASGVVVDTVEQNSPAEHAEVRQGDVITAFNGKTIADARELAMAVADTPNGQKASMTVWRNGSSHILPITIGSEAAKSHIASAAGAEGSAAVPRPVGMSLAPLTADDKSQLNLDSQISGVLVNQVTSGGHAEDSGVQAGDIILRVNGERVSSPDQVLNAIREAEQNNKSDIAIQVMRNGQTAYLGLQLA